MPNCNWGGHLNLEFGKKSPNYRFGIEMKGKANTEFWILFTLVHVTSMNQQNLQKTFIFVFSCLWNVSHLWF